MILIFCTIFWNIYPIFSDFIWLIDRESRGFPLGFYNISKSSWIKFILFKYFLLRIVQIFHDDDIRFYSCETKLVEF